MKVQTRLSAAILLTLLLGACRPAQTPSSIAPTTVASPTTSAPTSAPTATPTIIATAAPAAKPASPPAARPSPSSAPMPPGAVPDQPLRIDTWAPGDKSAVGTAYTYDQPPGEANLSRVWFALTDGAITEVCYPDVSLANVKSISLLVSDGRGVSGEMTDADHQVERLDGRTPAFRVTSTDKAGRWQATKQIVADPQSNALIFTVSFKALQGSPADYRLYLNYVPRLGNSGARDMGRVGDGAAEAWDEPNNIFSVLLSDPPRCCSPPATLARATCRPISRMAGSTKYTPPPARPGGSRSG